MRRLLRSLVAALADTIVECSDGAESVAAYRQLQPDWVLMDIHLPHMDGITATQKIMTTWPDAKVMIVTEYDHARLREAARLAGACEFVVKDDLSGVCRILDGWIGK